ncbi:MAG: hypothetical protein A3F68_03175 [Acidobacteria bacterium RIFCSPLOWO2_12_FULL_54_10]|nr:MAG: hypothetical protein A3F68_03175 [Acidobacteria bacterium RIFCSPLOWO2_12_FULL_54_10]
MPKKSNTANMKELTREQLENRKAQAVRFTRNVLDDDDRADEIEDESLEDYAERRHITITNPKGVMRMATPTRRELLERIEELENENADLESRLDEIAGIVGEEDDDEGSEEEEDEPLGEE